MERRKARITVIKRMDNRKTQEENKSENARLGPCRLYDDGQEFVVGWRRPAGFCDTAWADIRSDLVMIQFGGSPAYIGPENTMITCCRDGFRPVVFTIERLDERVQGETLDNPFPEEVGLAKLKITVLERTFNEEIAEEYGSDGFRVGRGFGPCPSCATSPKTRSKEGAAWISSPTVPSIPRPLVVSPRRGLGRSSASRSVSSSNLWISMESTKRTGCRMT